MHSSSDLILVIDAGTQSCKALVIDAQGRTVAASAERMRITRTRRDWAELEPTSLLGAVEVAVRDALAEVSTDRIAGIGVSAQLGMVPVDSDGAALQNIFTWMDKRAAAEANQLRAELGEDQVHRVTGRRIDPEWPACEMLWLRQNAPECYLRTDCFLSLKDFIVRHLTGRSVVDETHACYSLLFDVSSRNWHTPFIETLGLDASKLPTILPAGGQAGGLQPHAAACFGLTEGTPVITGGPDGTMAALGAGLVDEGVAVNVVGTTDVIFACSGEPQFDRQARTVTNCHVVPDRWVVGGPMSMTGGCVQWFSDEFESPSGAPSTQEAVRQLDERASEAGPGVEGLFCIPSLVGERAPRWEPSMRGAFVGLAPNHRRHHLFRAILEGAAYGARYMLNCLQDQGIVTQRLLLVGGGAKSRLWAQIRADVCGIPVVMSDTEEATAVGTAVLVAVATGVRPSIDEAVESMLGSQKVIIPNGDDQAVYDSLYARYLSLHAALRSHYQV